MTTNTVPQERPSRARTLLALVSMLDQLPAPEEIGFLESHPDVLNIQLASAADWDAWVKHFTAYVHSNRKRYESTVQCHASAVWLGWSVSLTVCTSNRGQERLTSEEAASVGGIYLPEDSSEAPSTARHAAHDYYAEDPAEPTREEEYAGRMDAADRATHAELSAADRVISFGPEQVQ